MPQKAPTYVEMPDGTYMEIPGEWTPEQGQQAVRNYLSAKGLSVNTPAASANLAPPPLAKSGVGLNALQDPRLDFIRQAKGTINQGVLGLLEGIGGGLQNTLRGIPGVFDAGNVERTTGVGSIPKFEPQTSPQAVGEVVGSAIPYGGAGGAARSLLTRLGISKLPKAGQIGAEAVGEMAASVPVAAAQGQSPEEQTTSAGIGAAAAILPRGTGAVAAKMKDWLYSPKAINAVLGGVDDKMLKRYNVNPGRRLMQEGVFDPNPEAMQKLIHTKADEAGKALGAAVNAMPQTPVSILSAIVKPIDELSETASFVTTAETIEQNIAGWAKKHGIQDVRKATPRQIHDLRREIDKHISSYSKATDELAESAQVTLRQINHELGETLRSIDPKFRDLQKRYAEYAEARHAIDRTLARDAAGKSKGIWPSRSGMYEAAIEEVRPHAIRAGEFATKHPLPFSPVRASLRASQGRSASEEPDN